MAKITQEQREIYQQQIRFYKNNIEEIQKKINLMKIEIVKDKSKEPVIRFNMANMILNLITHYCSMNEISVHLMEVKNTAFLEKARQQLYEAIINIEKIVTDYLDVPFGEYEEKLGLISDVSDTQRLNFIKKLGYCIHLVQEDFGENTKWKWSFIEIDGRFAVITKNLFDLKKFQKLDDPREEGFHERKSHFSLIQRLLFNASQGCRDKFELVTKEVADLKKAIDFQRSLLRLNQLTGDNDKIEKCKKQIEFWTNLLEKTEAQKEEEKRKKQLSR